MPTGVKKVLGFLREETEPKPFQDRTEVTEVCRIEVYNVTDTWVQLFNTLPASGFPGTLSFNPQQITFTFGTSNHPLTSNLYLQQASGIKKSGAIFWDITLQYSNAEYLLTPSEQSKNPKNRKDQKVHPLARPPVWTSSSQTVMKQTYTKGPIPIAGIAGDPITHANGLMLTEPFMHPEQHTTHSFSFNIDYDSFTYNTDIKPYLGKVSTNIIFGASIAQQFMMSQASCSEEYESYGQGDTRTQYHFIRVNVSFEYNPSGWLNDAKLVSRSTQQLAGPSTLVPIIINAKGTVAQEPWPLVAGGAAAPHGALDPANFAILDTGYPEVAGLSTFVSAHGLAVP